MEMRDSSGRIALGLLLMVGMISGGWVLGGQIKAIRLADRYVTVKGLVERTVKSDSATWTLSFKESGDDLKAVYAKSNTDKAQLLTFLSSHGITAVEITTGQISVTDRQTNEYGSGEIHGPRYVVKQAITVTSPDVDKISVAGSKTSELVQQGIVLGGDNGQSGGIVYKFNGLNALKPDMITEATRNAHASADRFAADSGSQVGSIRSANQGVFSISSAGEGSNTTDEGEANSDGSADASIMKKVRVVATIDYYLIK